ncbi:phosphoribosylanthranilate isomerase [Pseudochrobactrum sp. MP213Fo]|uniref:phosphoribosylanthranilate isomerase n=1 Tax=Pseudochrobactrum sp. MP213Fo TaxID=3022250 RepID=UPI003BA37146
MSSSLHVKICGLKTPEAVEAVLNNGASHIGFIFFPKSPRHVDAAQAFALATPARGKAQIVAVTVNADDAQLDQIVSVLQPDILQLHGKETPERVMQIKQRYDLPVIKAFSIRDNSDFDAVLSYQGIADRFLFDAKAPERSELPGGNGVSFDWDLLKDRAEFGNYMLSGGLNAGNIVQALAKTGSFAIDISSGVESEPGKKDVKLIDAFFAALQQIKNTNKTA